MPRSFSTIGGWQGSRYDGQIAVFGQSVQKRLEDMNVFLVGAGALGCEFIKNFALMGVACGEKGKVTMTDDDVIEKSNLSRQFLFRNSNIGQYKSSVAAAAAQAINPKLQIRSLQNRVSPESEGVFDDAFWGSLDLVTNALDNVNARLYVDSRCVYFCKPLLEARAAAHGPSPPVTPRPCEDSSPVGNTSREYVNPVMIAEPLQYSCPAISQSGTLGTKANTQMVIPSMTENYGASRDPPEKSAPMCTVHSFPHNIDHCLTWSRSEFEGLFSSAPTEAQAYLDKPADYVKIARTANDAQVSESEQQREKFMSLCGAAAACVRAPTARRAGVASVL